MPGPTMNGLFIYAVDPRRMAAFYESVVGMSRRHESSDLIILEFGALQLLVHQIPPAIAMNITITTPPQEREQSALKFFFTVPSLEAARERATQQGGKVLSENWKGPGFTVCNAVDPEGNIFQLREPAV